MAEAKGVPHILRAWLALVKELGPDCPPFWLVGGWPQEIELIRRIVGPKDLAIHEATGRLRWWGYLDASGISTVMLKAYVLVSHSLYEPGGRVLLEAMAQGIPVIATPNGFAADLIVDWRNGFLVDHGDINALQKRMEHFALQPLLRHAMGRAAQRTASEALTQWNFIDTHLHVYRCAIRRKSGDILTTPKRTFEKGSPVPRGFDGVYPFEGETVDTSTASAFFAKNQGKPDHKLKEIEVSSGRSRLWDACSGGRRWIVKHAFSTYVRRPMWDRGFGGPPVETQTLRISAELIASRCNGGTPVAAADVGTGLILREWMEPAVIDIATLGTCSSVLTNFHNTKHPSINCESIRSRLNRDWRIATDAEVVESLSALETEWRAEGRSWHAWKPMSIRLGWRWLKLGLRCHWLSLPASVNAGVKDCIDEESAVSANEEPHVNFGLCHGNSDLAHFRVNREGDAVLIDGEHIHPGYFGHDWASFALDFLHGTFDDSIVWGTFEAIFASIGPMFCTTRLLLSWLRWVTAMRLCRSNALLDVENVEIGVLRWRQLEHFTRY